MSFVSLRGLQVAFDGTPVLHGVDLDIERGEALGMVGESGCGKSVTWLAALGLLPSKAQVSGSFTFTGQEMLNAPRRSLEQLRGKRVAMIFQDPSSSLNPVQKVGRQIDESVRLHRGLRGAQARRETVRLMEMVGIPSPASRAELYPHEFSGGQCQRLMIAMALAGEPELLIADEPTTALDATIQAQILDLLAQIRRETGMSMVFISHDLGAVSAICERVVVMYAGRVVESNRMEALFHTPRHPYTQGLFDALPSIDGPRGRLTPVPGTVPVPGSLTSSCAFAPRCAQASALCQAQQPRLSVQPGGGLAACFYPGMHASWLKECA